MSVRHYKTGPGRWRPEFANNLPRVAGHDAFVRCCIGGVVAAWRADLSTLLDQPQGGGTTAVGLWRPASDISPLRCHLLAGACRLDLELHAGRGRCRDLLVRRRSWSFQKI